MIRANSTAYVSFMRSTMNFMKQNRSFLKASLFGSLWLFLLFPFSIQAEEFCLSPETLNESKSSGLQTPDESNVLESTFERGQLRVLVQQKSNACIVSQKEKQLIEQFAEINELELAWVYVESDWQLLPRLVAGDADIVLAQDQGLAAGTQDQIIFTHSWANAAYKIVERSDNSHITRFEDLAGRQVAAYKDSLVWSDLLALEESLTGLVLEEIPADMSYEEVMERVKIGQYDLAIADSLFLDAYLPLNQELQAEFNFSDERNMVWAVRAERKDLREELNQYLNQQSLIHGITSTYFDDLTAIKDRGFLRVITNSSPSHYYLKNGSLYGFEYELLRDFASEHRLRVDVVLANSQEQMFQLLREGKGDVIAASLPGNIIDADNDIQFTNAYHYASPIIVGRSDEERIIDLRELSGRRITLSHDNPYWEYMLQLQKEGIEFELVKADPDINMEGSLAMVALGMFDLSIIGSHQIKTKLSQELGLSAQFSLSEPFAHQWAVRSNDQQLNNALNSYIDKEYRKNHYNILHAKYFEQSRPPKPDNTRLTQFTSLSPYDEVTQAYADEYGFDWRLITALMFQESRFDPNAYSYAGAEGLMQLIPATAELMGVSDTNDPEASIDGGIRYLNYLRNKFEDSILLQDRTWFTLASYNAGYGRVKHARKLAEEMGLDKDRWFDNVELAMLAMAKPYMHEGEQVRLCRCGQAVVYVREIRTRYFNYIRLVETQMVAVLSKPNQLGLLN